MHCTATSRKWHFRHEVVLSKGCESGPSFVHIGQLLHRPKIGACKKIRRRHPRMRWLLAGRCKIDFARRTGFWNELTTLGRFHNPLQELSRNTVKLVSCSHSDGVKWLARRFVRFSKGKVNHSKSACQIGKNRTNNKNFEFWLQFDNAEVAQMRFYKFSKLFFLSKFSHTGYEKISKGKFFGKLRNLAIKMLIESPA